MATTPMAATATNAYIKGYKPAITPAGAETVAVRYSIPVATGDLVLDKLGIIGVLPARCVPVSCVLDSDDLDINATPLISLSVGVGAVNETTGVQNNSAIDTSAASGGGAWIANSSVGRTGTTVDGVVNKALFRVLPSNYDRKILLHVTAAAATAAAGEIGVTFQYRQV